jgi:hypothetical protein
MMDIYFLTYLYKYTHTCIFYTNISIKEHPETFNGNRTENTTEHKWQAYQTTNEKICVGNFTTMKEKN